MTILPFGNSIMSQHVLTRLLMNNTMSSYEIMKRNISVLRSIVSSDSLYTASKLSLDHGVEGLEGCKNVTHGLH